MPAAARLQQDHVRARLQRVPGRPHPRVAAADDHDVRALVVLQRREHIGIGGVGDPVAVRVVDHRTCTSAAAATAARSSFRSASGTSHPIGILGEGRLQAGQPLEDGEVGQREMLQRVAALEHHHQAAAAGLGRQRDRPVGQRAEAGHRDRHPAERVGGRGVLPGPDDHQIRAESAHDGRDDGVEGVRVAVVAGARRQRDVDVRRAAARPARRCGRDRGRPGAARRSAPTGRCRRSPPSRCRDARPSRRSPPARRRARAAPSAPRRRCC